MLTQGIISLEHLNAKPVFPIVFGDNSLKRHKGMFEINVPKNNQLKDKTTKYIHI
jgi:hypothetical protein